MFNTQNYNKYGYVLNNPLMYNDPNGEFFVFLGLGALFWKAVIIGAAVGLASYTVGLAVTGNLHQWNIGGALKATLWGGISGAVTFGIGSIFNAAATGALTTTGHAIEKAIGGFGLAIVQAGTHAVSQGVMSLMQGGSFEQAFWSGALGSLGASAFGAVAKDAAKSAVGTIAFGAISGGIGAELSGGNFWQGAVIGGIVAGLNHVMHKMDIPFIDDGDGSGPKKNNKGRSDSKTTLKDLKENPPNHPEYKAPKGGARKVKNPNGKGSGWIDKDGRVWVPTDHGGTHAPHWDRQEPKGGGYTNVYPIVKPVAAGVLTGMVLGGIKLLDLALSRIAPIFISPIIMQQQVNPTYQFEQQYH